VEAFFFSLETMATIGYGKDADWNTSTVTRRVVLYLLTYSFTSFLL
jgi:hypothetical protein